MNKKYTLFRRTVALLLVLACICPVGVAAAEARASYYLNSYSAYTYPAGSGKVQVYFSVTGVEYMDEIGALRVSIYESTDNINWTIKKTFSHDSTSGMLGYNDYYHGGHVTYQGVAGRYYKAYVCVWAGKDGAGDTRYFWTSAKKAT